MHGSVEVYLGDAATIPCQYTFKDVTKEPPFVMTQWFVVSPARHDWKQIENHSKTVGSLSLSF